MSAFSRTLLVNQAQIPRVDHKPGRLAQDPHHVHTPDEVGEQEDRADEAEPPEDFGHLALLAFLADDPLDEHAAKEGGLAHKPDGDPAEIHPA